MRRSIFVGCMTIVVLVSLATIGLVVPLDVTIALTVGWAFFLGRVLPEVTIAWDGVVTAVVCIVVFVVGAHAFLRWIAQQRIAERSEHARPWPFRWTAAMTGVILVMFLAGIAATGVVHQVGWLLTSGEPIAGFVSLAAQRAQSSNNLKQIGIGLSNYHDSHGTFPPGATFDDRGRPLHGWQAMLLPYVEHQAIYDQITFELPWDDPANREPFQTEVLMFLNPGNINSGNLNRSDAAGYALSHYSGNARLLGGDMPRSLTDLTDGASTTILAGEVATEFLAWGHPIQWRDPALGINRSPRGFGSPFPPGGANFVFADGSVRFVKETVDPQILKALSTPTGNEAISNGMY
ncbi:DUF1559 domain-containing protein [Tautonia rosea]|uniref:DUF1559 domain-containing protein n=1 Tax=Tautonia rosea TaxID=2728037 RepID=UPI0014748783|nr:DUF1559 domain-containing protein [Tautonia rosea]